MPVWVAAALLGLAVFVTRWPFRSHALFSWDSANFALALVRIDIPSHRPHPPGYLGYVFAGRALNTAFHDENTALVVWNMIATAMTAFVLAAFAFETAPPDRRRITAIGVTALVVTSPLVWFYGEVAEIYASDLLFASLIAYTAWRASRGDDLSMYACVMALAVGAVFKIVTAVLMLPMAAYAWTRTSPTARGRSAVAIGICAAVALIAILFVRPGLFAALVGQAVSQDWTLWRYRSEASARFLILNRHVRDMLTAGLTALGALNAAALIVWLVRDRRLPPAIDRPMALLWACPVSLVCTVVAIAKPGYLLPLLPLAALIIGGYYARAGRPATAISLIATQAIANVAAFVVLAPAPPSVTGGNVRYRDKPLWQRLASDLQPLTFATAQTIVESDARVNELLKLVATSCPSGHLVIMVDTQPVDWRRVMWYFPSATAIQVVNGVYNFIARNTEFTTVSDEGVEVETTCPVIWLAPDEGPGGVARPPDVIATAPHLGWMTRPGTFRLTRTAFEPVVR